MTCRYQPYHTYARGLPHRYYPDSEASELRKAKSLTETYKAQADEDGANLLLNIINPILSLIDRIYEVPKKHCTRFCPTSSIINADLLNVSLINLLQPVRNRLTQSARSTKNLGLDVSISRCWQTLLQAPHRRPESRHCPSLRPLQQALQQPTSPRPAIVVGDVAYISYSRDSHNPARFLVQTVFFRDNTEILKAALGRNRP